ncbi:urea ABC transporter ATP-binding subunit UrtE [Shinella oryzae]|uniref:urea ABC transporter ATP-binding subunit UrtE n=1 Tax=Shinella oryzae TaxID=2871820 RepID=UPI001FF3D28A|nr:urea ABC transporter ATP-binding subunit UrtE [Shinella oryzae]UPA27202.1 urea ABC transporter ATP-binding subunit UrtE [Shinella oryzae]
MLELERVNSFYGRSHALHDLTVRIPDGKITAIVGRNGTGKTTLLKTIMGLSVKSSGRIMLKGQDLASEPTHRRARAGIAYVPQGRQIIPDFSVRENILMGGFASPSGRKIPELVPELFPYLKDNMDRPGGLLSGGQQQQLAIARALAAKPSILLLDEPTEGIQPNIVEDIQNVIIRLNREEGLSIALVEQNVAFARKAGDHFALLEKGRAVATGSIEGLTDELIHRHIAV